MKFWLLSAVLVSAVYIMLLSSIFNQLNNLMYSYQNFETMANNILIDTNK